MSLQTAPRKVSAKCPGPAVKTSSPEMHGHLAPWLSRIGMKCAIIPVDGTEKGNHHRFHIWLSDCSKSRSVKTQSLRQVTARVLVIFFFYSASFQSLFHICFIPFRKIA